MTEGPFGGPRPFTAASLNASFVINKGTDVSDLELEHRLRQNGFSRADVRIDDSNTDSRTKITVITNEEQITYQLIRRLVAQVKDEIDESVSDRNIDIFCT